MSPPLSRGVASALVVPVPAAEWLVAYWRGRYDAAARAGVPAHVTLIYPFLPPARIDASVLSDLAELFRFRPRHEFALRSVGRFPEVTYLAPEPAAPFVDLTSILADRWPEAPPYRGQYDSIIPHLTVAQTDDQTILDLVATELARGLPITTELSEVWLILRDERGAWRPEGRFPLGPRA